MTCSADCKCCMYGQQIIKKKVCTVNRSITCTGNCKYCNFLRSLKSNTCAPAFGTNIDLGKGGEVGMVKLEKGIQGLEHCHADNCSEGSKCPYYGEEYCLNTLMYDALELLKGRVVEMSYKEKVIDDLNAAKLILCNPQMLAPEMCIRVGQAITSAINFLKEQKPPKEGYNAD